MNAANTAASTAAIGSVAQNHRCSQTIRTAVTYPPRPKKPTCPKQA